MGRGTECHPDADDNGLAYAEVLSVDTKWQTGYRVLELSKKVIQDAADQMVKKLRVTYESPNLSRARNSGYDLGTGLRWGSSHWSSGKTDTLGSIGLYGANSPGTGVWPSSSRTSPNRGPCPECLDVVTPRGHSVR